MMTSKRVVIAANTSWNIVNFRAGLIRALAVQGYEVIALAPEDPYSPRLEALGCQFLPLAMDNKGVSPVNDLVLLARFRGTLARIRPAAFLGFTIKPNVYGSLAAHSLRIPTINNISGLGTAFIRHTWLTTVVRQLYRIALRRAGLVLFQNRDDRALFIAEKLVGAERTGLLPGSGIDLGYFSPAITPERPGIRLLMIARLLRDKGVIEFVEAARLVRRTHPDAVFQLVGFLDVQNRTAISRQQVADWVREGVINYLGVAEDVRPFIAAADCVVLPSYREGTPRTLLEAAAMGKPLIATDVPGCREVIVDGENGFLCRVRSSADLAAKIENLIRLSPQRRFDMGAASRRKVEREFNEQIVIDLYLRALSTLLA